MSEPQVISGGSVLPFPAGCTESESETLLRHPDTVEADLIEEFVREMGSVPWFNSNRPSPVYDYSYEPEYKFRHAVLQGRGSRFP